jgi:exonuclease SbcC
LRDQQTQQAADLKAQVESLRDRERQVAIARAEAASVAERLAQLRQARAVLVATDEAAARVTVAVGAAALAADALARFESDDGGRDVDGLAAAFRALEDQVQVTVSARDAAESLVGDLHKRAGLARAAVERVHDTYSATTDVIALANIMRGGDGNTLAQPLSAYVVQTMFDEILQAANRRLQVMLDGRFSLQATERRTGNARLGQGLGLEVVDQRTDTVRKTATLSGGESFCASLALALGLADTVRSHAGGVELGMLFIDEGFGSLDGHRLDEVMAELLRLRSDGRTVGVISHVSEMKKGINERIDVTSLDGRRGSTLSVSWTD